MIRRELAEILHTALGLNISSIGARTLERSINRRVKELNLADQGEYVRYVRGNASEINLLIDEVVIPETWFFRDTDPFIALADMAGRWFRNHPQRQIKILSIPCASGEEPYSIAMTLLEAGIARTSFRLDAVDVSSKIIERAKKAIYTKNSFRNADLAFRDKYFTTTGKTFALQKEIRSTVNFYCGNILDPDFMAALGRFDIIFCRNILFYLDADSQQMIVRILAQLLQPEGCIFVGAAEAIRYLSEGFSSCDQRYGRATILHCKKNPAANYKGAAVAAKPASPENKQYRASLPRRDSPVRQNLSGQKAGSNAASMLALARQSADAGRLKEAEETCQDILRLHGPMADVYYLLGILYDISGQLSESVKLLKKALYLLPDHQESLLLLTYLSERLGDQKAVTNYKRRLKRLGEKKVPHPTV